MLKWQHVSFLHCSDVGGDVDFQYLSVSFFKTSDEKRIIQQNQENNSILMLNLAAIELIFDYRV